METWRQRDLLITRDQAVELKEDEYFITDLIGLTVVNEEEAVLGRVKDVLETGANDVYVVELTGGKGTSSSCNQGLHPECGSGRRTHEGSCAGRPDGSVKGFAIWLWISVLIRQLSIRSPQAR